MPFLILYQKINALLDINAEQLPPFLFRLILAYEFWEAGMMKYNGENWFTQQNFPFPFSLISSDILWFMATWLEIIGAIALVLGLGTRTVSLSLMIYFARLRLRILQPLDFGREQGAETGAQSVYVTVSATPLSAKSKRQKTATVAVRSILTLVAIKVVHWPAEWDSLSELWRGYAITNKGYGNFKLPLLYLIMFVPLLFGGAGRWSLDYVLNKYSNDKQT